MIKVSTKSRLKMSFTSSLNQVSTVQGSSMTKTEPGVLKTVMLICLVTKEISNFLAKQRKLSYQQLI
jgi:hypothetical protein